MSSELDEKKDASAMDEKALRAYVAVLEYRVCFVPEESSSEDDADEAPTDIMDVDAFMPPQAQLAKHVLTRGKTAEKIGPSELLARADFEMPDAYERIKMYMKMLFDFIRTHPKIKGKHNERNFSFVLRRAINVLNDVVRLVAPTPNKIVLEPAEGTHYSKLWKKLVAITSYMYDYDDAFEMLAKTYAYYAKTPVRHNVQRYSLRGLASIFFGPTPTVRAPEAEQAVKSEVEEPAFVPKLSKIEFDAINAKLIALHEFLVGASADRMKEVNMAKFNESAENDPWYYPKKKAF